MAPGRQLRLLGRRGLPRQHSGVVETSLTFGISLAHGFRPTSRRATVTLARGQEVLELDGQPAADVYCRMVQLPRENLAGKHLTLTTGRPLGILDPYGQYSINVATFFTESGGVRFTQPAPEGTCLTLMSADHDHLVAAGGEALCKALRRGSIKDPAVALVFSCALRSRILGSRVGEEISGMLDLAPQVPMVGFYSFGEQGLADDGVNRHNNEVIAVLALGRDLSQAAQTALENESLRVGLRRQDIVVDINKRLAGVSEKLRALVQASPLAIYVLDAECRVQEWNPAAERLFGWSEAEALGRPLPAVHPDQPDEVRETCRRVMQGESLSGLEVLRRRKDGSDLDARIFAAPLRGPQGQINGIMLLNEDITDHKRAREALKKSEATLQGILKAAPIGIGLFNRPTLTWVNEYFSRIIGYTSEELIGKDWESFSEDRQEYERVWLKYEEMITNRGRGAIETCWRGKDGRPIEVLLSFAPVNPAEPFGEVIVTAQDISERKQAEDIFKSLFYTAPIGIFIIQDRKFKLVNPAVRKITGLDEDDLLGQDSFTYVPEDYKETMRSQVIQMLKGERTTPCEFPFITKGGEPRWVLETVTPIQYQGERAILGFFIDVHERVMLEEQLLQSLRMEAVGRLAGGVAHDFNNMLTAIMGYSELIMMSFREEDPIFPHLEGIRKSAERAAALTRQLLAFSRKQLLQPRVINLNTVITNLETMLRRLIGEDINLIILLDPALKAVKADPGQFEQVIMNLVINARDAMPLGGKIIVQTANVYLNETFARRHAEFQPGPYVQVSVTDHGLGMNPETLAHIFDPFFTTKAPGKGTGLGLSTVYGIIKQSGGQIEVSSQHGGGTVFEIYLPQIEDIIKDSEEHCDWCVAPQGSETVMVVEDEELLLALIQEALEMHGYHVLTARNPTEALERVKGHAGPICLLLTDVVMPQKNGRELAELLAPLHPEMKILFMSGYTEDSMVIRGLLNAALPFIQKPFPPMDLVCKVREMIDSPRR
jgi:PAS domain S-box-containing protein